MNIKWQSNGLYEHPAHTGTHGNVLQYDSGIYALRVGAAHMSCPQDWASGIHAAETEQRASMIVRGIPESLRREFKSRCATEGKTMNDKMLELMNNYVSSQK